MAGDVRHAPGPPEREIRAMNEPRYAAGARTIALATIAHAMAQAIRGRLASLVTGLGLGVVPRPRGCLLALGRDSVPISRSRP